MEGYLLHQALEVLEALDGLARDLPDLRFVVVENQARFIEAAVGEVEAAAVRGARGRPSTQAAFGNFFFARRRKIGCERRQIV